MSQKRMTEIEVQEVMNELIKLGHAEKDGQGRYRLTALGLYSARKQKFDDCLAELGHESALTYAGFAYVTQLEEAHLNELICVAIKEGTLVMGCLNESGHHRHIFHLACRKVGSQLHLLAHPSEKKGDKPHWAGEQSLLKKIKQSDS